MTNDPSDPPIEPPVYVPAVAMTLAVAVVAASTAPLLLLDHNCDVMAASDSFLRDFEIAAPDIRGQNLYRLGHGEWDIPRLHALLDSTLAGAVDVTAYEIDFRHSVSGKRRLVLNATVLDYRGVAGVEGGIRLLLSIADVTAARLAARVKEELLAEKAVLLQELQHRVANSLQIIASVLMQSARKLGPSSEAQSHLKAAHSRVMSVAALQRQLAESAVGDVDLGSYLKQLCQSLGASMIEDHELVSLTSTSDDSRVEANKSVSIGLVVTELVINALKHAFPDSRSGHIGVDYASHGLDWTLAVSDDGIGMPPDDTATAGLGTNIVNALARHLDAEVKVTDEHPGTRVALVHVEPDVEADDPVQDESAV
jgi:two-component sensor histidine kinase